MLKVKLELFDVNSRGLKHLTRFIECSEHIARNDLNKKIREVELKTNTTCIDWVAVFQANKSNDMFSFRQKTTP